MKKYQENKICFIICTNSEQYLEECLLYLSLLIVPQGYEVELLTIKDAESMTMGYNEGMEASSAQYKIYLHQDTLITESLFLVNLLKIFESDQTIGLVGMVGTEKLSKDGVMWHGERCGDFYRLGVDLSEEKTGIKKIENGVREVMVADGFLLATREDIPWREDILKGWDFYDVSQCLEFRRAGFKVVVPAQNPAWVVHACGAPAFWNYNQAREIVLKAYPEIQTDNSQLSVLFIHSTTITMSGIPFSMMTLGHRVDICSRKVFIETYSEEDREHIEEALEEGNYDIVMTYDFIPSVADACKEMNVKYLAWVYDSPLLTLYTPQALHDTNYICVFDKKQYERLKQKYLKQLYYFPLAADIEYFGAVQIDNKDQNKFGADVSFLGSLYSKRGYEELMENADQKLQSEAFELIKSMECTWDNKHTIFDRASDGLIDYMVSQLPEELWSSYSIEKRYYCESMRLARKANEEERLAVLNSLAMKHKVDLYTTNTNVEGLQKSIRIHSAVDYWDEMPKVFHLSKINLNISSRSIESGIPQRIFDIMAVGGFVLTNYQPELEEYFVLGTDLEVYHNLKELHKKVDYYLRHEKKRVQIAMSGYKKVRDLHSLTGRLTEVLEKTKLWNDGN